MSTHPNITGHEWKAVLAFIVSCIIFIFVVVSLFGCCPPRYIEKPPVTKVDTVYVDKIKTDTIRTMVTRWLWKDSVLTAKVDTVTMKLWYRIVDRDTIIVVDTLKIYQAPEIVDKTWLEKVAIISAPFLVVVVVLLIIVVAIRK